MSSALAGGFFTTRDPWKFLAKTWKQPKCPLTDEWTKNMWSTVAYCSAIKKHKAKPFATTWMGLEMIVLSDTERSKSDRDRQRPQDVTYTWNLTYGTRIHPSNRNRLTDRRVVVKGKAWSGNLGLADENYYI